MAVDYIETFELKQRGWTPALIARLLGEPVATRPSELVVGRHRRPAGGRVSQYLRAEALLLETGPAFLSQQQQRAERMPRQEQQRAKLKVEQERAVAEYVASYPHQLPPPVDRVARTRQQLWSYHDWELKKWEDDHDAPLYKLPRSVAAQARQQLYAAHKDAFYATYPSLLVDTYYLLEPAGHVRQNLQIGAVSQQALHAHIGLRPGVAGHVHEVTVSECLHYGDGTVSFPVSAILTSRVVADMVGEEPAPKSIPNPAKPRAARRQTA